MEMAPVPPAGSARPGYLPAVPRPRPAAVEGEAEADPARVARPGHDEPRDRAHFPAESLTSGRLEVRVERRPEGGQILTVYDRRTGEPILQLPPEQVLQVIEHALRRTQDEQEKKESHHGDR